MIRMNCNYFDLWNQLLGNSTNVMNHTNNHSKHDNHLHLSGLTEYNLLNSLNLDNLSLISYDSPRNLAHNNSKHVQNIDFNTINYLHWYLSQSSKSNSTCNKSMSGKPNISHSNTHNNDLNVVNKGGKFTIHSKTAIKAHKKMANRLNRGRAGVESLHCIVHHLWDCGEWTSLHQPTKNCYWAEFSGNGAFCPKLTVIEPQSIEQTLSLSKLASKLSCCRLMFDV